jgi:hypothetical protein
MRHLYLQLAASVAACVFDAMPATPKAVANDTLSTTAPAPVMQQDLKGAFPVPAPNSGNKYWWTGFCSVDTKAEYDAIVKSLNDYRQDDAEYQMDIVSTYLSGAPLYANTSGKQSWELFGLMPFKDKRGAVNPRSFIKPHALLVIACDIIPGAQGISNARGANPAIWDEIPTGMYDKYYVQWATSLKTVLQSNQYAGDPIDTHRVILRMAWEYNWRSYSHSAIGNLEGFKRSWRHIVGIYRKELPGVRFELHTVVTKKALTKKDGSFYSYAELDPGPEYVDFYGMAFHEGYPTVDSDERWDQRLNGTKDSYGYEEAMEHAKTNHRMFACGEWSPIQVAKRGTTRGTERPDLMIGNPDYKNPDSRGWFTWLYKNRQFVAYEAFFHASGGPITSPTWDCAQMYRKIWMSDDVRLAPRRQTGVSPRSVDIGIIRIFDQPKIEGRFLGLGQCDAIAPDIARPLKLGENE